MEVVMIQKESVSLYHSFLTPFVLEEVKEDERLLLGLMQKETAIGALAVVFEDGFPEVISIYVSPDYRRKGGGTLLMNEIETIAKDQGADLIVRFTSPEREPEGIHEFLKARGYRLREEPSGIYSFKLGQVKMNQRLASIAPAQFPIVPVERLAEWERKQLTRYALLHSLPISEDGFLSRSIEPNVSMITRDGDGKLMGCCLVETSGDAELTISALYSSGSSPSVAVSLIKHTLSAAKRLYKPETRVLLFSKAPSVGRLVKALVPGIEPCSYVYEQPCNERATAKTA